jgi:hypothetical protein
MRKKGFATKFDHADELTNSVVHAFSAVARLILPYSGLPPPYQNHEKRIRGIVDRKHLRKAPDRCLVSLRK